MSDAALKSDTREIVFEEVFPHAPETVWKVLTSGQLMARWLRMTPVGFAPVKGQHFTYQTTPAGGWDGVIHCEVLEVRPIERFAYAWRGGDKSNVGYGAPLDTIVTFDLSKTESGTRLRLVHSGFVLPKNETAFTNMSNGWKGVVARIGDLSGQE
jgi:uncharacterized protein YndB with AHSA1/START domain